MRFRTVVAAVQRRIHFHLNGYFIAFLVDLWHDERCKNVRRNRTAPACLV